mmetsp:Transcript_39930/g.96974  ORF Transcript_39930/g.96974 Transcript_39930/m.96974 type:complete len:223 (-) Transcript_39930:757-1425(-)
MPSKTDSSYRACGSSRQPVVAPLPQLHETASGWRARRRLAAVFVRVLVPLRHSTEAPAEGVAKQERGKVQPGRLAKVFNHRHLLRLRRASARPLYGSPSSGSREGAPSISSQSPGETVLSSGEGICDGDRVTPSYCRGLPPITEEVRDCTKRSSADSMRMRKSSGISSPKARNESKGGAGWVPRMWDTQVKANKEGGSVRVADEGTTAARAAGIKPRATPVK